jgi:sarcosine oxidase subunit beta
MMGVDLSLRVRQSLEWFGSAYDLEPDHDWPGVQIFSQWAEMIGGECNFARTGFLQLVKPQYVDQLKANVTMHQRIGIPSLLISADDVHRLAPAFKTDDIEFAAFEPESGYADPSSTTQSLLDSARQQGARLVQDCMVTGLRLKGDRVIGVQTSQGEFASPVVVNAAGAWAAQVGQMAGLDLAVTTWQHDTMFIRRPKDLGHTHPTVIDFPNEMYFRPETGGLTLVGLEDANPIGESPEGDTDHAKSGFVDRAIERICQRIPGMDRGSLHSAHGGYDGITPDQRAIIGQSGVEGFYLACGFSGTGFKIAPAVGICLAELIVDGQATTVDITPFRLERFSEGRLLTGKHSTKYLTLEIWEQYVSGSTPGQLQANQG